MIAAIEWTVGTIRSAADVLVVEFARRPRREQLLYCGGVDLTVWVPRLFKLDDHEGLWRVIADAADEAAFWRVRASE